MLEEDSSDLELVDLGDAVVETKQCNPFIPLWVDSIYGYGSESWPGNCG